MVASHGTILSGLVINIQVSKKSNGYSEGEEGILNIITHVSYGLYHWETSELAMAIDSLHQNSSGVHLAHGRSSPLCT